MRRHHLASVAAIALALSMTAASAQNVESQRDTDQGKPIDQVERNQQPQTSGQSQNTAQAHTNQDDRPGTQSQQGAQQSRQSAQGPQGGDTRQAAGNEQPDRSGLIALDEQEQTRISDIIRRQRIQPLTNVNFSLSVASTVPSSVRLSRISGELADIFPSYRDFSFFVAKQELVIVDPQSYGIVAFVPISSSGTSTTVGTAAPREDSGAAGTPPPPLIKKKAARTERKRVTVTEDKPSVTERETIRRSPPRTETDVTVGTSRRRDIDAYDEPPPRDRPIGPPVGPPVRERVEHDDGPPFPFSLFFGGPR
jgi:Protein of unknown function (DUF1236)